VTVRRRLAVAALALSVLAAGCSNDDGADEGASSTSTTEAAESAPTTTGPLGSGTSPIADGIRIEILSSQPDRVTGDEARVRVTPPPGGSTSDLQLLLDDRDVTSQLVAVDGALEGVVTGMIEGNGTLTARAGDLEAIQRVRAWPRTGPVFSGPQPTSLTCTTDALGLGAPLDDACSAAPVVRWRYVRDDGSVADLASPTERPADLATTTVDGREVPMVVRVERGVTNRSPYEIAWLDDAPQDEAAGDGWNGALLYRVAGDCATTYAQGALSSAVDATFLREGYAIATASFTDPGAQCNDVVAAETASMVKERVIEAIGRPAFTIGEGRRGGAALLHLVAQNYPGIVNGIVATEPLPDHLTSISLAHDCLLLARYDQTPAGRALTDAQRVAIAGGAPGSCAARADLLGAELDPVRGCDALPPERRYEPTSNRSGLRCTFHDAHRNQLGTDPTTGWAHRPIDNVGLQYGVEALNAGDLSFEQFLDLNRSIGGLDADGTPVAERTEAELEGVALAYETGRVSMGGGDQLAIPIIDLDLHDGDAATAFDHLGPFALRDRLTRGAGAEAAPGFQIWTIAADDPRAAEAPVAAVAAMRTWLEALAEETGGGPLPEVLARTRPDDAVDRCWLVGEDEALEGVDVYEEDGACADAFDAGGDPRTAAGGPSSGHVLKCELRVPDPSDYAVELTADQFDELLDVFPTGVCDFFVPSVGQTTPAAPDRTYEDVTSPEQSA
jgi:hypothetical protein